MKRKIIILMILYFIFNIGINLGHPVTPSYVRYLGIPEYMFGVFYATMSFGAVITAPFWGSLGDTGKSKLYLCLGLIIYGIAQIGFGFAHNQYLMVFFRLLGGIGVAAPTTLFVSLIIACSDQQSRLKNLAIYGALATLGASVGYQIGGFLGDSVFFNNLIKTPSYENIFLFQALFNLILGIVSLILIKEEKGVTAIKKQHPFSSLGKIKTLNIKLILFLISLTLITMGSTNLSKYIDVYFNDLGLSTTALGNFVLVTGIVSVIASVFIVPLVSRLRNHLLVIVIIQTLSSLIIFYVFRANKFILNMYTVYNVYVIFKAIYLPMEQNYISRYADEKTIGTISGIRQSFVSIGNVIGPFFGGMIYSFSPLWLFDVSGILILLGTGLIILIMFLEKRNPTTISE